MKNNELDILTDKIDALIVCAEALSEENRLLKSAADGWQKERERLVNTIEEAQSTIKAMINKLQGLS